LAPSLIYQQLAYILMKLLCDTSWCITWYLNTKMLYTFHGQNQHYKTINQT